MICWDELQTRTMIDHSHQSDIRSITSTEVMSRINADTRYRVGFLVYTMIKMLIERQMQDPR